MYPLSRSLQVPWLQSMKQNQFSFFLWVIALEADKPSPPWSMHPVSIGHRRQFEGNQTAQPTRKVKKARSLPMPCLSWLSKQPSHFTALTLCLFLGAPWVQSACWCSHSFQPRSMAGLLLTPSLEAVVASTAPISNHEHFGHLICLVCVCVFALSLYI